MTRTTIVAEEHVIARLKALARERGVSFSQVVREALAEKAEEFRPKPKSIGAFSGGSPDLSERSGWDRTPPR